MKHFLFIILFISYCLPVYSGEIDGKALLKKGKNELENKKFEDAIFSLSAAEREFPMLGDYALLWLSDAYHENGKHRESLKTIRTLLDRYPHSPLWEKARIREIKEAEEVSEERGYNQRSEENIQQIYEAYIKDFPCDAEVKYLYALWLKKNGKEDTAKSVFKEIYLDAGIFSKTAFNELNPSDITVEDLIKRASNLMSAMDFKGAEAALRSAMDRDDGRFKNEILKNLGLSLFKQRRYRKAAEVFEEADRGYWQVRSLYRAGEKEVFNSALDEFLKSEDKRAGQILVSLASDERRDGRIEEAIKIYQNVVRKYPSETEDALWGIGWTYFLTGEYKKAADIFTNLYETYNDIRYLYWKARSLEADGEDAFSIYHTIMGMEKEHDFYSIMSYMRTKRLNPPFPPLVKGGEGGFSGETQKSIGVTTPVRGISITPQKNDRVEALFDLGLSKEALLELIYISRNTSSIEDILYICSKLQELREYKYLVRIAVKVPHMEELLRFRYPLAYWDVVEGLSGKYSTDPLLVLSVVREESRFDSEARSTAGALGLMQIMPGTAYRLDNNLKLGINGSHEMLDVKNNLHLGIFYLRNLINEFGSYSHALAAYNAGEETVRKWLRKGNYKSADEFIEDIPYSETRNYVKRVITTFFEYNRISSIEGSIIKFSLEKL
ncbi:MAG: transglycosylase SLT domain-containing protein [Nitrospirota bacterium]